MSPVAKGSSGTAGGGWLRGGLKEEMVQVAPKGRGGNFRRELRADAEGLQVAP